MKRLISMLLVVAAILLSFPAAAFADEVETESRAEAAGASQVLFARTTNPVYLIKGKTIQYPHQPGMTYKRYSKNVFTVSSTGELKGLGYGVATLKVTFPDGTFKVYSIEGTRRATAGVSVRNKQDVEVRVRNNYANKRISKVKVLLKLYNSKNQEIYKKYHTLMLPDGKDPIAYGKKGIWNIPFEKANISKAKVAVSRVYYEDGTSAPN